MATTSPWNIPLFDDSAPVAPLQTLFNAQSSALNSALTAVNTGFKQQAATPVNSVAERAAIFPVPAQGNAAYRTDLGYEERYFASYHATSNPSGATPAGWYPLANSGPYWYGHKTIDQSLATGQGTAIVFDTTSAIGMTAAGQSAVSIPLTGWYRLTANLGAFNTTAGGNRWLYVTKNTTEASPRVLSVTTSTALIAENLWNASKIVLLSAGDVIRMGGLQDSGTTATLNNSSLSVEWVGHTHG